MQPGFGHPQLAVHGSRRDFEGGCGFLVRESTEGKQLDDVALARVMRGKTPQSLVQRHDFSCGLLPDHDGFVQRNRFHAGAALLPVMSSGMVHENAAQETAETAKK